MAAIVIHPFQARVARLALSAAAGQGFALAGANALVAHGLLARPTQDVDLFTPNPGGPGHVLVAVVNALIGDSLVVRVTRAPADNADEFARLQITSGDQSTQLDLGRDWRAREAVILDIGPVLHLDDAVASKVTRAAWPGARPRLRRRRRGPHRQGPLRSLLHRRLTLRPLS